MGETVFYDTLRQGLWVAVLISTPILVVALVSGLVVGLFQALTSIQEMTLTFVPKLAAIAGVFWITMGFMTETLVAYWRGVLVPLIAGG
ncbi:flagellar biosynthetic protein FliQ [Wenxinia saemankumensis]|uniref:Flagellar biosynthetic protein FliQ n=1 Tax=Wenxinia saemankumensis TaxID=1447782 RepID=A0A1M6G5Z7_9RHOB|nr:flagellar biosynthetic protein FliQ [Wenxinia saemankumensis]SHJ05372.1 flagellar biosynthetic protein FliQ [Wenxinia saemankumensis]